MTEKIRTRFAPSPTGYVHVGSIRTALYNFLFSRNCGGDYILRIEDTDQSRKVEGSVENLLEMMKIAGIQHDEGPDNGGEFGPYYQSERLDLYQKHIQTLLASDKAYKCFCTAERLEEMRKKQEENGEDPGYDGKCRHLSPEEIKSLEDSGAPYVIRMRVPQGQTILFDDVVRGKVSFESDVVDDQVLIKSDGFPTYHFANVVDDHSMEITHVIRGEEWLPSTPKHILLYEAFGWTPPRFAHLPLLLNPDRKKLSKRQGDVAFEDFLNKGFVPEALINFLALLGWNSADDKEIYSLEELISEFSLERVNKSGAVFDREKLDWINAQYLKSVLKEERFLELAKPYVPEEIIEKVNSEKLQSLLLGIRPNLNSLFDIKEQIKVFFADAKTFDFSTPELAEIAAVETNKELYSALLEKFNELQNLTIDDYKACVKSVQKEKGIKGKNLFMPLRLAFTGQLHGPDLSLFVDLLGLEEMKSRLILAMEKIS
jgi:glutamyl-tRNA synthetase